MAIYIPGKIKVGYQNREDTFTKKLAYVIYFDNFGKLRKETSWQQWRDKEIEPQEFENVPTSGFILNKGHTRYNWSHFGNSKTVRIRIYDPRGIEFEITAENLVAVLMHTDCSRREITGELVYAWNGTELMLLPCCSEEYTKAKKYTELQAKKFSAKDLKEGATYLTKSEKEVIYLGRFMYYQWEHCRKSDGYTEVRVGKKQHIFYTPDETGKEHTSWNFKPLSPSGQLAVCKLETPIDNYAELVDFYLKKCCESAKMTKMSIKKTKPTIWDGGQRYRDSRWVIKNKTAHKIAAEISTGIWGRDGEYVSVPPNERLYGGTQVFEVDRKGYSTIQFRGCPAESGKLVLHFENGVECES